MSEVNNYPCVLKADSFSVVELFVQGKPQLSVMRPDAAIVIPVDDDGNILLTYEKRKGKDTWYLPAGRKNSTDQTILDTARREMREESGFDAREIIPFFATESKAKGEEQSKNFFIARKLFSSPLDTGDEVVKPKAHFKTPEEVWYMLGRGEINDDIAAALFRYFANYVLIKNKDDIFANHAVIPQKSVVSQDLNI